MHCQNRSSRAETPVLAANAHFHKSFHKQTQHIKTFEKRLLYMLKREWDVASMHDHWHAGAEEKGMQALSLAGRLSMQGLAR